MSLTVPLWRLISVSAMENHLPPPMTQELQTPPHVVQAENKRSARSQGLTARILREALQLFMRQGYVGASMDQIASLCDTSKETLYKRYLSKAELFAAAVDCRFDRLHLRLQERSRSDSAPLDALRAYCRHISQMAQDEEIIAFSRLLVAESLRFPDLSTKQLAFEREIAGPLQPLLIEINQASAGQPDTADEMAARILGLMYKAPLHYGLFAHPPLDSDAREAEFERTWTFACKTVLALPPPTSTKSLRGTAD